MAAAEPIILASASLSRAAMLRAAGVDFTIEPAAIDEANVKLAARRSGDTALDCARRLAMEKACCVSRRRPAALVIGGDQILDAESQWFDKPGSRAEALAQLRTLRGRTHRLATAACCALNDAVIWQATSSPELTMHGFSDDFLDRYIAAEGDAVLGSVGAYRLEARGAQLFTRITGDYFAVLGLPLLELLAFLRGRGVMPA